MTTPKPIKKPGPKQPLWRRVLVGLVTAGLVLGVAAPLIWVVAYRFLPAPGTSLMAIRALEGEDVRRNPVSLSEISPNLVRAVIAAEDARFCSHHGFDLEAIEAAIRANADGGRLRGGSTISQQTAKNLFLWPDRSWVRKGAEAYFTVLIETLWPKRRILETYLNSAEWGDGVFGAEAAARVNFGKSARRLTRLEAARLAAVLPSPNRWSADAPGPYVRARTRSILANMRVVDRDGLARCILD
jgi:monofunctional biosynthetic peptidoglycan transglycosylase